MSTVPTFASADGQREFILQIGDLFNDDTFSDLVLIVGEKRFDVHKAILATRSEYFRTFFTSNFVESKQKEVTIEETDSELFEKLLRFIYSNKFELKPDSSLDETLDLLRMVNKYLLFDLQLMIENHLISKLSMVNVCSIYSTAFACSSANLKEACFDLIDGKPSDFLKDDGFLTLSVAAIEAIIRRNSFDASQAKLFRAIWRWSSSNGEERGKALLKNIQLSRLSVDFLATVVRTSGVYSDKCILDAIAANAVCEHVPTTIQITVDVRDVGEKITLNDLEPLDTIADVKRKIKSQLSREYGIASKGPLLLYRDGILLKYRHSLESYGITNGTSLATAPSGRKKLG